MLSLAILYCNHYKNLLFSNYGKQLSSQAMTKRTVVCTSIVSLESDLNRTAGRKRFCVIGMHKVKIKKYPCLQISGMLYTATMFNIIGKFSILSLCAQPYGRIAFELFRSSRLNQSVLGRYSIALQQLIRIRNRSALYRTFRQEYLQQDVYRWSRVNAI